MKRLAFILSLLVSVGSYCQCATFVVRNQTAFDRIDETIREAVRKGNKNIQINITPGCYEFHESHIQLKGLATDIAVSIVGRNVKIYPASEIIKKGSSLQPQYVYYKKICRDIVDFWTDTYQASQLIEVVDSTTNLCRIKLEETNSYVAGDFIKVSQSYQTRRYSITEVRDGYLFFVVDNLKRCDKGRAWTINYDYVYGKEMPRYRIWESRNRMGTLREGRVSCFIDLTDRSVKKLHIKGLQFIGNASKTSSALILLKNVNSHQVSIEDCSFQNCHSKCIIIDNSSNVIITRCEFHNNLTTGIYSGSKCQNIQITDCQFENNSCGWNNTFCINIKGKDFMVARNTFRDFGYGAIGIGEHYGDKKVWVAGIVEDNELYYTPQYYADYRKHTLMDGGAIYLWTQNDNVVIRNNYIHDYIGMKDNRGIFCDDGASNFTITGNTILRIANSYSIDSRRIKDQHPKRFTNNVNITITDNTVDGSIRFEGRDTGNNGCVFGRNTVKTKAGIKEPIMKIESVKVL